MEIISELGSQVLKQFTPSACLIVSSKLSRGDEMIDLRVHRVWDTDHQLHSTKNGLFVCKRDLLEILPSLIAFVEKS